MMIVTLESVPGKDLQPLGIVMGSMVQAKHIGKDFMSGLKNIVGGELTAYSEMMEEARNAATDRMIKQAAAMGADAVVGVRYVSSAVAAGAAEMLAYGTAVKFV